MSIENMEMVETKITEKEIKPNNKIREILALFGLQPDQYFEIYGRTDIYSIDILGHILPLQFGKKAPFSFMALLKGDIEIKRIYEL